MSPKKRTHDDSTTRRAKKQKLGESGKRSSKHLSPLGTNSQQLSSTNEIDFPRGGGSNFTPLEHKIIHNEAMKEVEDELVKDTRKAKDFTTNKRRLSHPGNSKKDELSSTKEKKGNIRVEYLNYKRIVVGMKLLCQVVSVQPLGLVVSLPNQLLGHIPITQISSQLSSRLDAAVNDDDNSDDDDDDRSTSVPDLSLLFSCGKFVRAIVTAVKPPGMMDTTVTGSSRDPVEKASRRVELSLIPDQINANIAKVDMQPGFALIASVKSVEDHGYILDTGIRDLPAFLSYKDVEDKETEGHETLQIGALVDVVVKKLSDNGRTCNVKLDKGSFTSASTSEVSSVSSIVPGLLVQSIITGIFTSGLHLQILGHFVGTVDLYHIDPGSLDSRYKVGQKVKARVLYDVVGASPPQFSLSLAEHIVSLREKGGRARSEDIDRTLQDAFSIGTTLQSVKVVRVEPERGLIVEIGPFLRGHVHISHVSDDHVSSLSATSGPWRVDTNHRARVIGYHALDGILQLSLRQSVLDQKFLQVSDVHVGEIIRGTVKRLTDTALFVSMSGNTDGVIWPNHFADIPLKHPQKRFKPDAQVKARVLAVDSDRQRIILTAKKTLVESDLPIISRMGDASIGMIAQGFVRKIFDKSLLVEFYNNTRAVVPSREASDMPIKSLNESFYVGKPVKVRIISVDISTSRMLASIKQASTGADSSPNIDGVEVGKMVHGAIRDIHTENVLLELKDTKVTALLSLHNLANHRNASVEDLRSSLKTGEILDNLIVVSRNLEKGFVIVANRPRSKSDAFSDNRLKFSSLDIGQIVVGRVAGHGRQGALLKFSGKINGTLHPTDVSDDYGIADCFPSTDSTVRCSIIAIDRSKRQLTLSTRPSRFTQYSAETQDVVDPEITKLEDIVVGQTVRGFIKNVVDHGVFVSIGRDIDARVQIKELYDDYVKEWKNGFKVNQLVQGRILGVDLKKRQVEMSLRLKATSSAPLITMNDLKEGQKIKGRIKKIEDYGVFIEVNDSKLSGLCHKSELSDNSSADVANALRNFREGDIVNAIILSIDLEKQRIALSLKPSYFSTDSLSESGVENDFGGESSLASDLREEKDSDGEKSSQLTDADKDEEAVNIDLTSLNVVFQQPASDLKFEAIIPLQLSGGFQWANPISDAEHDQETFTSSDEGDTGNEMKSKRKRKKQIEYDLTAEMQSKQPESTADYERLLLGSPNSSYLWIQYMSFQLQLSEVDKARDIGRRALQAINIREEQEKLNVWIALLNLENSYGTDESLEILFKEAVKRNDSKTIYLRLALIFEQSSKAEKVEELYGRICKKFAQSSKVWTLFGEFYFRRNELDKARSLLPRCLQSLEKRKHLKTISKFAQMEYKMGTPERGKTIFEGIIDSHSKRWDLWSIYIDMEVAQKDLMTVRYIFDRVLSQKMTSHKAKAFFKKWLEIERRIGDAEGVEKVKEKAIAWTQQAAGSQDTI